MITIAAVHRIKFREQAVHEYARREKDMPFFRGFPNEPFPWQGCVSECQLGHDSLLRKIEAEGTMAIR